MWIKVLFPVALIFSQTAEAILPVPADEATKNSRTSAAELDADQPKVDDVADDPMPSEMLRRMQEVEVFMKGGDGAETQAILHPTPVFRYTDEPRWIHDATLWVWTIDGRPVAMQKLEANSFRSNQNASGKSPKWTHCFSSLSPDLIKSRWPEQSFEAKAAGVEYAPISKAPVPDSTSVKRKLQIRQLSRRFSAVSGRREDDMSPMRMMPRPIFEFSDSNNMPLGAIFGLEANGTNPDMLLIISAIPDEDGKLSWQFGISRMTDTGAKIKLDEFEVLSAETVNVQLTNVFDNWMFFYTDRTFLTPTEQKAEEK